MTFVFDILLPIWQSQVIVDDILTPRSLVHSLGYRVTITPLLGSYWKSSEKWQFICGIGTRTHFHGAACCCE